MIRGRSRAASISLADNSRTLAKVRVDAGAQLITYAGNALPGSAETAMAPGTAPRFLAVAVVRELPPDETRPP